MKSFNVKHMAEFNSSTLTTQESEFRFFPSFQNPKIKLVSAFFQTSDSLFLKKKKQLNK